MNENIISKLKNKQCLLSISYSAFLTTLNLKIPNQKDLLKVSREGLCIFNIIKPVPDILWSDQLVTLSWCVKNSVINRCHEEKGHQLVRTVDSYPEWKTARIVPHIRSQHTSPSKGCRSCVSRPLLSHDDETEAILRKVLRPCPESHL